MKRFISKKISLRRVIIGNEKIPKYFRTAYHASESFYTIMYPIGIHWIVKVFRRLWEWSLKYNPSKYERMIDNEKAQAYDEGKRDYVEGVKKLREQIEDLKTKIHERDLAIADLRKKAQWVGRRT